MDVVVTRAELAAARDELAADVRARAFPGPGNSASMDEAVLARALDGLAASDGSA